MTVEWRDGRQRHSEQVPVSSAGGVLRFGDEVVGAGARRMVHGTDGWLSLWGHDVAALGPSPTAKYRLTVEPGPDVAGRPTDMVVVAAGGGQPAPGAALRRPCTAACCSAGSCSTPTATPTGRWPSPTISTGNTGVAAAAGAPRAARSQEPAPARHLKAPYKLKSRIGTRLPAGRGLQGRRGGAAVLQRRSPRAVGLRAARPPEGGPDRSGRRDRERPAGGDRRPHDAGLLGVGGGSGGLGERRGGLHRRHRRPLERPGRRRCGTCRTPIRRAGSVGWPRRWCRCSGGGEAYGGDEGSAAVPAPSSRPRRRGRSGGSGHTRGTPAARSIQRTSAWPPRRRPHRTGRTAPGSDPGRPHSASSRGPCINLKRRAGTRGSRFGWGTPEQRRSAGPGPGPGRDFMADEHMPDEHTEPTPGCGSPRRRRGSRRPARPPLPGLRRRPRRRRPRPAGAG